MALLPNGFNPTTLEDVLNKQASSASANQDDAYIQAKKRKVASEAASGRLMSGVSDYPLGDLETENTHVKSGIQDKLAGALAGIPEEDWLNGENFKRQYQLAQLISSANKPSTLDEVFQGIGSIGPIAAMGASFL